MCWALKILQPVSCPSGWQDSRAVGITGGNIHKSGVDSLCMAQYDNLCDALPLILGK